MTLMTLLAAMATTALVAWAGGLGGATARGVPVMWWCAALAFATQWLAFGPAWLRRTERYYDLMGTVGYLLVLWAALGLTGSYDARSLLLVSMVSVWTLRLGLFLFRRIHAEGGDGRFDEIKRDARRFLVAWTLQGLWVFLTASAALAAITTVSRDASAVPLAARDGLGTALWVAGMTVEIVADSQKRRFRRDPSNRGRFITSGLWSWSRHPNYFAEIVLWAGVAVVASAALEDRQWFALISPLFVVVLLTRVGGIPLLERRADERWGGEGEYEAYKARTSILVPRPPRR